MHDVVEIVYGQASICVGFSSNAMMSVVAFTARLVSTSSREKVRYAISQGHTTYLKQKKLTFVKEEKESHRASTYKQMLGIKLKDVIM